MGIQALFRRRGTVLVAVAVVCGMVTPGMAGPYHRRMIAGHPRVNQVDSRFNHQQRRIQSGEESGRLSQSQVQQLEQGEHNISQTIKADRANNNGHLTQQEHQQINQMENQESHQIWQDKHSANTNTNSNASAYPQPTTGYQTPMSGSAYESPGSGGTYQTPSSGGTYQAPATGTSMHPASYMWNNFNVNSPDNSDGSSTAAQTTAGQ